jgi:hypothetical protein
MLALVAAALVVSPPHLATAPGWHVGSTRAHACPGVSRSRCVQEEGWASTVRYRDCADCVPPHRTLAHLPPSGIVIQLSYARERPVRMPHAAWPPRIRSRDVTVGFEGEPQGRYGVYEYGGRSGTLERFVFVWFGRPHPTRRQLARANAELRSAR